MGRSQERSLTVTNRNLTGSQLVVDASVSDPSHFSVQPHRLLLGPGQVGELRVRFTPRAAGTFPRQLILANNSAQPSVSLAITGVVATLPKLHVQLAAINFGATPLGTTRAQAVRFSNLGDGNLTVSNVAVTTTAFKANASTFTVAPGGFRDLTVTFTPSSALAASALLQLNSNDPTTTAAQVALTGAGSDRFWYRQRRGNGLEHLDTIALRAGGAGVAAGEHGVLLRQPDSARAWLDTPVAQAPKFNAIAFIDDARGWLAGPAGTVYFTSNGGSTWTVHSPAPLAGKSSNWRALAVMEATGQRIAFAGEKSGLAQIVMGTSTTTFTTAVVPATAKGLRGVAFATNKVGVAVGDGATILRSADEGKTWQLIAPPAAVSSTAILRAVTANPANATNFVIVGNGGLILNTTDGGLTWLMRSSSTAHNLYAVTRTTSAFFARWRPGRRAPIFDPHGHQLGWG